MSAVRPLHWQLLFVTCPVHSSVLLSGVFERDCKMWEVLCHHRHCQLEIPLTKKHCNSNTTVY